MKYFSGLLLAAILIFLSGGCASLHGDGVYQLPRNLKTRIISGGEAPLLRSGQIIVSESGNDTSLFFALFPEIYSPFIHAGVLVFEEGEPYVYEGLGSIPLFMGSVPTDAIKGQIRRRHLSRYLEVENYAVIFNPPDEVDHDKVAEFALFHYKNATPFDPYMDSRDIEKLYCTEFVAHALYAGGSAELPMASYRKNRSLELVHAWLKITDPEVYLAAVLVKNAQHVATLSARSTPREILLYVAAREELHRRFTGQQRIGYLFEWNGFGLKFRPPVGRFVDASRRLLQGHDLPDWPTARAAVRKLAVEHFGPFVPDAADPLQGLNENPVIPAATGLR